MTTEDLQLLVQSGALNPEQMTEAKDLLFELHMERISADRDEGGLHLLAEAGVATMGAPVQPRDRRLTAGAALLLSGIPTIETEFVDYNDLPMAERLAVITGIGDERAAAMSESSGVPLRGGDMFLGNEADLRAAFGQPDEDVSAEDRLGRLGIPLREATAVSSAGALQRAPHETVAPLDKPSASDLEDAAEGEDVTDVVAPLDEAEARGLLGVGGIPLRHGALA